MMTRKAFMMAFGAVFTSPVAVYEFCKGTQNRTTMAAVIHPAMRGGEWQLKPNIRSTEPPARSFNNELIALQDAFRRGELKGGYDRSPDYAAMDWSL